MTWTGRLSRRYYTCSKISFSGSFIRVSFAFNSLPQMYFWWRGNVSMKREEMSFIGIKLSWHDYQLSMSFRIKCLWNYKMKLYIKSGYFIQISFHSIWHDTWNNTVKLSPHTGLKHAVNTSTPRWTDGDVNSRGASLRLRFALCCPSARRLDLDLPPGHPRRVSLPLSPWDLAPP
jgi:hypothetical protein